MLRRAVSLRYGAERQEETRASDWMALTMTDLLAKLQMELTGLAALTRGAAPAPRTLDRIVLARTHENIIVAERRTLRSQPVRASPSRGTALLLCRPSVGAAGAPRLEHGLPRGAA